MKLTKKRHRGGYRLLSLFMSLVLCFTCLSGLPVAVAADEGDGNYTWTKVTSAPSNWEGEYLLVYEADSTTAYVFTGVDSTNDYVETSINSSTTITADKTNAVTLEAVDGGYVLKNASGDYLYQSSDKNGLTTSSNQSTAANYPLTVSVTEDGIDLELSSGPHMRFNATSNQMRFRYYSSSTYTNQKAVTLYALDSEDSGGSTTESVETPSLTYSETDKTVTFKCATSGVTYYYSFSESGAYTVLDGNSLDVSDHIGETLYAYAELDGSKSEVNSVELTAASTEPTVSGYELITGDITSGDQVMIYYPAGGTVITGTASGSKLTGGEVTVTDGVMGTNNVGEVFTVYVDESGYLSFVTDEGAYLTCGSTGNSLTLGSSSSDYSLWTLESAGESGSYYIKNVNASYNGNAQYIEYYSGFTTFGFSSSNTAIYIYQFYYVGHTDAEQPSTGGDDEDAEGYKLLTGDITSGDQVMIYYPQGGTVITGTASGSKLTGGEVTVTDEVMETNTVGEVFTIYIDDSGYLSFVTNEGKYLACGSTGNSLTLESASGDYSLWTLENAGESGSYYIKSVNAAYNGNAQYIEYYNGFTTYGFNSSDTAIYTYQFYYVGHTDAEQPSTGGDDDTTTTLEDGTYVIWAPNYNMALTSTAYATYYLAGEEVTLTDDTLSGYTSAAVWTVTVTTAEDGTQSVTLAQDDSYLGVVVSGSYYNLTFGATENTEWTLEDASEVSEGCYYLKNTGTGRYLEWYASKSDWSLYSSVSSSSEGMFALQFTPVEDSSDDDDTTLTSGTYVVWNPAYGYALSSTTVSSSSSYYAGVAVTESESGKMSGYGDTELWVVTVSEDGTLTLEQNGSYMGMNSSNYLTFGSADTLDHYTWTVEDAGDGLYYLKDSTSGKYVEWYSSYSDWSTYYSISSGSESLFALKFSPVSEDDYTVDTSVVEDIAQWGGGGAYEDGTTSINGDKYTVNDQLDSAATFTTVVSGTETTAFMTTTPSTGGTTYYMGTTGLGSGTDDYMQFAVSTAGWGDMELSFRMRVTGSGSGEWQLQYSTDGENFTNFTTGTYSCSYTAYSSDGSSSAVSLTGSITDGVADMTKGYHSSTAYYVTFSFDVPEGAENAENLYIRLVPSTTLKANGSSGTPGSSSTIRIDSVVLSGSPIVDDSITGYVTVSPDNSEDQAVGTELTLTSSTEGATIYYRFVDTSTGEGTWQTYDESNKPTLDSLPATLEVYATSEGRAKSVTRILTYAAGTVSSVKFSPNGGGVYIEEDAVEVTLTSATEGATIYYAITYDTDDDGNYVFETDSDSGEVIYTEYVLNEDGSSPISLVKGFDGASIKAYAELEGYTTSAVTTRTFTERSQESYNIYFGQLHSHTNYSDGAGSITDAYDHALEVHETTDTLDFLAVTDHSNSFDNASSDSVTISDGSSSEEWTEGNAYAEEYTTDGEFVALFGFEMTWSNGLGHINTYNTDGFQSRTQSAYTTYSTALQNYYDTLKTVTDSISQFNHPGTTFGDFQDFSYYDEEIDELITLIEVGNGEGTIGSSSYFPSYEYYTRALDKGWHVAPTNNQDNHKGLWGDANTARSVVLADSLTEESIYDAMRNYRVYATEDNDLSIYYTLDGNIMGTILSESDVDDTVTLSVTLSDPTDSSLGTVSVIVNGGYVLASQTVSGSEDTITFNVSSDYSYYYIKVVEADGDIAVTAPVWVGDVEAVGISTFESDDALAVQDEALNMTLSLYNNESSDFEIESITFTVTDLDGNVTDITDQIVATTDVPTVVESMDTADYSFYYIYDGLGSTIYTATVTGTLNGVTKVYTEPLTVSYVSSDMVTNVVVDGSHYNDYVTGYYGGNMTELETIAADLSIKMNIVTDVEDYYGEDSVLSDCALLIISAPAKKSGTANAGDYTASLYEDEFLEAVAAYVEAGGSVIVCGLADYGEASSSAEYHTAAQQNKLLEAIGSTMSLNDDEAYDVENNGGQAYRLYLETFNMDSEWLSGVVSSDSVAEGEDYQTYSQYSGCTVNVGEGTWLVNGFDTTYSIDSDKDGVGASDVIESGSGYNYNVVTAEGEATFLACEDSGYGGTIFVSGGVFCSDFEVDADVDDYDLPYANTTIITNILQAVQVELPVTDIATVREAYGDGEGSGSIYKVRGYVTAGTANEDTTFFDCIYIQDETGGIDIFPYAESGLELGTYIEVTGYLASYQGDIELKVMSYTILDDENLNVVDPTLVTCAEASDYDTNGGMLLQVEGTVTAVYYNSDGTLAQFTVSDSTGESVVFIDGYILSGTTGENTLADTVTVGATVSAVGVLYMHPETLATDSDTFGEEVAVLRVRDCDEIVVTSATATMVDFTALNAAITTAESLTESDYTSDSWSVLAAALAAAQTVAANADATQTEVDEATTALTAAIEALVAVSAETTAVDFTALNAAIVTAEGLTESDYTSDSWSTLATALTAAQTVAANADATQTEVDDAATALTAAIEALVTAAATPGTTEADDSTNPTAATEETDTSSDTEQTDTSSDTEGTDTSSDTEDEEVDTSELLAAIEEAEALDEDDYTADSWSALQEALETALAVAADEDATQDEIDEAAEALIEAIEALEEEYAEDDEEDEEDITDSDEEETTAEDDEDSAGSGTSGSGSSSSGSSTGDSSHILLWALLALMALALATGLEVWLKKRENNK